MKELLRWLIGPVAGIIDKVVTDKDQHDVATMADRHAQEAMLAQIAVNKAEAKGNWIRSLWRPLCGFVWVLGLAINFLISPIAACFNVVITQADMSVMILV